MGAGGSEAGREGSEPDGAPAFQWPPPSQSQPGQSQPGQPGTGQPVSSYGPPVPSPGPDPATPPGGQPPGGQPSGDQPFGAPPPGQDPSERVRFQEPGVTQPRPPTVGEARARDKARARRQETDLASAEAARKKSRRKKILIGSGAVVGVVGLVAIAYAVVAPDDDVATAQCVTNDGVVVEDRYCDGSPNSSGVFLVGGSSYRYNYGGYGSLGQRVRGGSTVYPRGVDVRTPSGATIGSTGSKSTGSGSSGSGSSGSGSGGSSAGSGSSGGSDAGSGTVSRGGLGSSSSGSSSGS